MPDRVEILRGVPLASSPKPTERGMRRRSRLLSGGGQALADGPWREVGSSNLAGRIWCATIASDGSTTGARRSGSGSERAEPLRPRACGRKMTGMTRTTEQTLQDRLSELRSLSREIYRARPDLQAAFDDPEGPEYWAWIQSHGFTEYPQVRVLSVPVPPFEVRRFVGSAESLAHLATGAAIYRLLSSVAADTGRKIQELGPILDFGCGSGRALRFFLRHALEVRCVGTDVYAPAIDWCRANLPFFEFHVNRKRPPSDLPSAAFGFAYAISIFSHLSEENHFD